MSKIFVRAAVAVGLVLPGLLVAGRSASLPAGDEARLRAIFADGRTAFFETVNAILDRHFLKADLTADDLGRIRNAREGVPFLFERIINIGYQKDALAYQALLAAGDEASLAKFAEMFRRLAQDYAARFVGSLFRKEKHAAFAMRLPHNQGKSTLDLVLQTLGYKANNKVPDVPLAKRFVNPVDPDLRTQWAVDAVRAPAAWRESRGRGVVAAMLDSGIDPYNALFKDRLVPGFSFLDRTTPPWSDENPPNIDYGLHGTGVSSALLAIAPECRIMMIRTSDSDTMNDPPFPAWLFELEAAGIHFAIRHGAGVISHSAMLAVTEPPVAEAVRAAFEANVPICSSAGNISRVQLGLSPEDTIYPAFDQEVLLIGGVWKTEQGFRPWPFSVPNPYVDVAAPSDDVYVFVPTYLPEMKNMYVAGTSLSAPIAAGAVALMRSAVPPTPELLSKPGEYVALVSRALRETARLRELALVEPGQAVGAGLIDAEAAIKRLGALIKK